MLTHILYGCSEGKIILLSRLSKKLTKLGVKGASVSNLSRVFQGRHEPGYPLMKGISQVLGIPLEEVDRIISNCRKTLAEVNTKHKKEDRVEAAETKGGGCPGWSVSELA